MTKTTSALAINGEIPHYDVVADEGPVRLAAQKILRVAREGGSLFVDRDVWTTENLDALLKHFVRRPDVSGNSFFEKLERQLQDVDEDARLLFVEIFALQMLPISQFKVSKKIENLERVLGEAKEDYEIPREILDAFETPVFGGGPAFAFRRFQQLAVMIEFFRYLRSLDSEQVEDAYRDPLRWRSIVMDSPGTPEPSIRASLTYLGHPQYFFPVVSQVHKRLIVEGFFPRLTGRKPSKDLDADLAALREWLNPPANTTPDFYRPGLSDYWRPQVGSDEEDVENVDLDVDDSYSLDSILDEGAFHERSRLGDILRRWEETRNVILQGAPGTGKTWLAKRLAYSLIGQKLDSAIRSVQFHPGTSYEDFVRGWRPGGDGRLTLVDGPLLQHAARARANPDIPHVLIIEEFNRGNPAQALGEMLTLLERTKRNEESALELTYMREGERPFSLPENLFVLGTMNTADRSLALVDFALRRRFAFFELEPSYGVAWKRHLAHQFRTDPHASIEELGRNILALNSRITADRALGPSFRLGHSYFTPGQEATEFKTWLQAVVESSIRPQLAEYWYDETQKVDEAVEELLAGI